MDILTNERDMLTEGKRCLLSELTFSRFEVAGGDGEPTKITGIISVAETENLNHRLYPLAEWMKAIAVVNQEIARHPGLADHPEGTPSVADIAVNWTRFWLPEGSNEVWGEGYIVPTAKGRDVAEILKAGVDIGLSTRAYGTLRKTDVDGRPVYVVNDLALESVDFVVNPSEIRARVLTIESLAPDIIEAIAKRVADLNQRNSDMNEDTKEQELNTETPITEDMQEKLDAVTAELAAKTDESLAQVTEANSRVESLTAELDEFKANAEESAVQLSGVSTKLEEATAKLAEVESEKAAIAESAENFKAILSAISKQVGESLGKEDFYQIRDLAWMGQEAMWMRNEEMYASAKAATDSVESALKVIAKSNLERYIREKCQPEKHAAPLAKALISACHSVEDVDKQFDEMKLKVQGALDAKPNTKGEVTKESELTGRVKTIVESVQAFRHTL